MSSPSTSPPSSASSLLPPAVLLPPQSSFGQQAIRDKWRDHWKATHDDALRRDGIVVPRTEPIFVASVSQCRQLVDSIMCSLSLQGGVQGEPSLRRYNHNVGGEVDNHHTDPLLLLPPEQRHLRSRQLRSSSHTEALHWIPDTRSLQVQLQSHAHSLNDRDRPIMMGNAPSEVPCISLDMELIF